MNLAFRDEIPPVPLNNNRPGLNFSPRLLLLAGIGTVAVIISFILISISASGGISPQLQHLSARLATLQVIIKDANKSITDPDLRKITSDLSILTTGSIAQLAAPMKAAGLDKVSDEVKKAEADTVTLKTLADAKLAGTFDRTYARTIKLKLDTILALMNEIYTKTKSRSLKTALSSAYKDFGSIRKQLDEKINV